MAYNKENITPPENRQGRVNLQAGLASVLQQLDSGNSKNINKDGAESAMKKAFRAQKVLDLYRKCMIDFYGNDAWVMLEKTNAVYIVKEPDKGMRRKADPEDKIISKLIVYTSDSTVHSELDNRQEQVKLWFIERGEHIDRIELLHAKLGMRRRAPYLDDVRRLRNS